jgi:hypothetical protein
MPQTRQVWSHTATRSSIIAQKCGTGNDATIKIESAMMLQVVLRDDDWSRQGWWRKSSYETAIEVGNDAASHPTRRRFKSAKCCKRDQVCSHTAARSSIIPQTWGSGNDATVKIKSAMRMPQVVIQDDDWIRQWCRKSSYKMTIQAGNDAASRPTRRRFKSGMMPQTRQVWSHTAIRSSIIPQKCGSGKDATTKIKTAMTPQVVLWDDNLSWN